MPIYTTINIISKFMKKMFISTACLKEEEKLIIWN